MVNRAYGKLRDVTEEKNISLTFYLLGDLYDFAFGCAYFVDFILSVLTLY